jgi:hypothetical protein
MTPPIGLKTAGPQVELEGVNDQLLSFAAVLDRIHQILFIHQMVITSARDGVHSPASRHEMGLAIDIRTIDKDAESNMVFLMLLNYAARNMPITIFDERNLPGAPHIHLEWHGGT